MNLNDIKEDSKKSDIASRACLNFCTTVCMILLADHYKNDKKQINFLEEESLKIVKSKFDNERENAKNIDPLLGMMFGNDNLSKFFDDEEKEIVRTIKALYEAVRELIK